MKITRRQIRKLLQEAMADAPAKIFDYGTQKQRLDNLQKELEHVHGKHGVVYHYDEAGDESYWKALEFAETLSDDEFRDQMVESDYITILKPGEAKEAESAANLRRINYDSQNRREAERRKREEEREIKAAGLAGYPETPAGVAAMYRDDKRAAYQSRRNPYAASPEGFPRESLDRGTIRKMVVEAMYDSYSQMLRDEDKTYGDSGATEYNTPPDPITGTFVDKNNNERPIAYYYLNAGPEAAKRHAALQIAHVIKELGLDPAKATYDNTPERNMGELQKLFNKYGYMIGYNKANTSITFENKDDTSDPYILDVSYLLPGARALKDEQ